MNDNAHALTDDELAEIRKRAEAYERTMSEWAELELGTRRSMELDDRLDILRSETMESVPALLDHVSALTARAEAAEAALRAIAEHEVIDIENHKEPRDVILYLHAVIKRMKKQAADALAGQS